MERGIKTNHLQKITARQTKEARKSWLWLKNEELIKETEGITMAAQSQTLKTAIIGTRIDKM